MRFLGIGEYNDLAAMYHGLARRGHQVRVHVEDPSCRDIHAGMLAFTIIIPKVEPVKWRD